MKSKSKLAQEIIAADKNGSEIFFGGRITSRIIAKVLQIGKNKKRGKLANISI